MEQHRVTMPEDIETFRSQFEAKEEKEEEIKEDPTIHYDKEDLISFHQLFISKPLVKAAHDLEYEHPTVIQR